LRALEDIPIQPGMRVLDVGAGSGILSIAAARLGASHVEAMEIDLGSPLRELRVDGGASVMDVLCQFQADLLGIPVSRPRQTETTALGAAFLAGLGAGAWTDADLADLWKLDRDFEPAISRDEADALQAQWRRAVERSRAWSPSDNQ
jgi:glycerol kinase